MRFYKKIKKFLYSRFGVFYSGPVLKNLYDVSNNTDLLATLTVYDPDQFWCKFLLTPITMDYNKLDLLYSEKFWWSKSIVITEKDSGNRVKFIPAIFLSENEEKMIDYFKERPEYVNLRGPYEYE